jgi:hypothetical protein
MSVGLWADCQML